MSRDKKKETVKLVTETPFHDDNYHVGVDEVVEWIGDGIDVLVTGSKEARLNGVYHLSARRATLEEEIEKVMIDEGPLALDEHDVRRDLAHRIAAALRNKGVRL